MPNCFSLSRKTDPNTAVAFSVIDAELCAYLNVECHPVKYHCDWYETIGYAIAVGVTFEKMRDAVKNSDSTAEDKAYSLKMIDWFDTNFVSDAWAEIGRR